MASDTSTKHPMPSFMEGTGATSNHPDAAVCTVAQQSRTASNTTASTIASRAGPRRARQLLRFLAADANAVSHEHRTNAALVPARQNAMRRAVERSDSQLKRLRLLACLDIVRRAELEGPAWPPFFDRHTPAALAWWVRRYVVSCIKVAKREQLQDVGKVKDTDQKTGSKDNGGGNDGTVPVTVSVTIGAAAPGSVVSVALQLPSASSSPAAQQLPTVLELTVTLKRQLQLN